MLITSKQTDETEIMMIWILRLPMNLIFFILYQGWLLNWVTNFVMTKNISYNDTYLTILFGCKL